MIYPYADDILHRGNFDEMISRGFESGKIRSYDEEGVRKFLSLENLRKALRKEDSVEYKYKRSVSPDWLITITSADSPSNGSLYLNSDARQASTGMCRSLSNAYFPTMPT